MIKVSISGVDKMVAALRAKAAQAGSGNVSGVIGYSQAYAVYVHENLEMKRAGLPRRAPAKGNYWDGTGGQVQSKFLEAPFRIHAKYMAQIIKKAVMEDGRTIEQGILLACLFLQRESQRLVPVDTGALKNSAFTRIERS